MPASAPPANPPRASCSWTSASWHCDGNPGRVSFALGSRLPPCSAGCMHPSPTEASQKSYRRSVRSWTSIAPRARDLLVGPWVSGRALRAMINRPFSLRTSLVSRRPFHHGLHRYRRLALQFSDQSGAQGLSRPSLSYSPGSLTENPTGRCRTWFLSTQLEWLQTVTIDIQTLRNGNAPWMPWQCLCPLERDG